jgi:hypothetical protein
MRDLSTTSAPEEDNVNTDTKLDEKTHLYLGPFSVIRTPIFGAAIISVISGLTITSKIHSDFEIFVQCMKISQLVIDTSFIY